MARWLVARFPGGEMTGNHCNNFSVKDLRHFSGTMISPISNNDQVCKEITVHYHK